MRRGIYIATVLAAAGLGLWWFWPRTEPRRPTVQAASAKEEDAPVEGGDPLPAPTPTVAASQGPLIGGRDGGQAPVPIDSAAPDVASRGAAPKDEDTLLGEMRAILKSDPKRAEALGRAYQKRFPNGTRRDEADAVLVYAIYNQRRIDRAQEEAFQYFKRHPQGKYTEKLAKLTRLRPPRSP